MFSDYEKPLITSAAILLSLLVFAMILNWSQRRDRLLAGSTLALTGALLAFYHLYVRDPAHGIGILILPLLTGWLRWRHHHTGRPALSQAAFVGLQILASAVYLLGVWLQEH
jgi:hypothetical protein